MPSRPYINESFRILPTESHRAVREVGSVSLERWPEDSPTASFGVRPLRPRYVLIINGGLHREAKASVGPDISREMPIRPDRSSRGTRGVGVLRWITPGLGACLEEAADGMRT